MAVGKSICPPEYVVPVGYHEPLLERYETTRPEKKEAAADDEGNASFVQTCLNGLNALSGVGLLSVPYALSEGGWLSLALLAAVAAICWYTGVLLQRCMAADPAVIRTYPDIGERAFGRGGRLLVSAFMYAELYLVAIGFLILDGDNLDKLFPDASVSLGPAGTLAGRPLFVVLVAVAVAPTTWLRGLGVLSYVSATGVFASLLIVLSLLWAAAFDGVGFSAPGTVAMRPAGIPTALGLYTFCYCGHAVFPTLYTSMKEKSRFPKMLAICFVLCTLNYGSMAVLGYLMYGGGVESQVTLNLPAARVSSKVAIFTTLINPLSKYALVVTPIATAVEERICGCGATGGSSGPPPQAVSVAVRTVLVVSTVAVALAVPFFAYLMALVGSLLSVGACMLLPCACYVRVFGPPRRAVEAAAILAILAMGSLVVVTGTYSSVVQITNELF
ncbi:unnamed protein product [Urochloa decumbens]|uniref:Amino acid transporter transmembrane domain-containing protein n=1 Tax=Urochloa decumbens TaxID=240449 RepID=A0ABC9D515_9POAL